MPYGAGRVGRTDAARAHREMSLAPARILSTQLTRHRRAAADIVVLTPASCVIDPDTFYSKGKNSPFRGYAGKGAWCIRCWAACSADGALAV